ncbi:MAG TPA: glycosyl hydrolase family 18 protein [Patescibacteria group bacterium]|nr:glycosyl hydrolase family 18 protein [Patescibacteria group bacterium]
MTNNQTEPHHNNTSIHRTSVIGLRVLSLTALGLGSFLLAIGVKLFRDTFTKSLVSPVDISWYSTVSTSSATTIKTPVVRKEKNIVYGFLPYWNAKDIQLHPEITHIGYFSLPIDRNGKFTTTSDEATSGWKAYHSDPVERMRIRAQENGQKFEILITMMDADEISAFLMNKKAQEQFFSQIKTFIKTQPIDGINIDIEYAGTVDPTIRSAYTTFIANFSSQVKRVQPSLHISIDVFADSALKNRIWDIAAIEPHIDHIVIMTYDFFRSSSSQSGPVAPLFGSEKNRWDVDIVKTLKPFFDIVPPNKLLLGIPFYGYEWQTVSAEPGAFTYPKSGGIATYKRVQKLIQDLQIREQWDKDAMSPFLTYTERGNIQTIYYENSKSLSYKLDLVNESGMGGIAIWALGYEGKTRELWDVIGRKM